MNWAIENRNELKERNYVLTIKKKWNAIAENKFKAYFSSCGSDFNLILFNDKLNKDDYYIIPHNFLKDHLISENLAPKNKNGRSRWFIRIKNHQLKIGRGIWRDIFAFYGSNITRTNPVDSFSNEEVDYSGRNKKVELNIRVDSTAFRSTILGNFNYTCCLTGTTERNLLDASHIKPRSHDLDNSQHPGNGLCFTAGYHRLFDHGYFSFDENLNVVITESIDSLSDATKKQLKAISKKNIAHLRDKLNMESIHYHYNEIFKKRLNLESEPDRTNVI